MLMLDEISHLVKDCHHTDDFRVNIYHQCSTLDQEVVINLQENGIVTFLSWCVV